jgi:hypothetical protein
MLVDMSKLEIPCYSDTESWNRMEMAHKDQWAPAEFDLAVEL